MEEISAHGFPSDEQLDQLREDIAKSRDHLPFLLGLLGHRALSPDEEAAGKELLPAEIRIQKAGACITLRNINNMMRTHEASQNRMSSILMEKIHNVYTYTMLYSVFANRIVRVVLLWLAIYAISSSTSPVGDCWTHFIAPRMATLCLSTKSVSDCICAIDGFDMLCRSSLRWQALAFFCLRAC